MPSAYKASVLCGVTSSVLENRPSDITVLRFSGLELELGGTSF